MNWQRKHQQLFQKITAVLQTPGDDKLWHDETFWHTRWPQMVYAEAHALEMSIYQEYKNNPAALATIFKDRLPEVAAAFAAA